jgi:hypothetical protein
MSANITVSSQSMLAPTSEGKLIQNLRINIDIKRFLAKFLLNGQELVDIDAN